MNYRKDIQAASTSAISWQIGLGDGVDVKRITLLFATAPTTTEDVTITYKSDDGDCVLRKTSAVGVSCLSFENVGPSHVDDYVLVEFPNTDTVSVKGIATVEI